MSRESTLSQSALVESWALVETENRQKATGIKMKSVATENISSFIVQMIQAFSCLCQSVRSTGANTPPGEGRSVFKGMKQSRKVRADLFFPPFVWGVGRELCEMAVCVLRVIAGI